MAITVTNGVCLVLSAFILLMTVFPRAQKDKVADALDPASEGATTLAMCFKRIGVEHGPTEDQARSSTKKRDEP